MPKVIFNEPFQYRPSKERLVTICYKASSKAQAVNQECAEQAEALGVGEIVKSKKTDDA